MIYQKYFKKLLKSTTVATFIVDQAQSGGALMQLQYVSKMFRKNFYYLNFY